MIETHVELPAEAVVSSVIEVVAYIDEDGDWAWGARWEGERPATLLGLLKLVEDAILKDRKLPDDETTD